MCYYVKAGYIILAESDNLDRIMQSLEYWREDYPWAQLAMGKCHSAE